MTLYTKEDKMSEVIFAHPSALTLLNRFGIFLGVGDSTIGNICRNKGLDSNFFLLILNTYLNEDYFPEKRFAPADIPLIADYLARAADYYVNYQLPNIERHFNFLERSSQNGNNNLLLLKRFFLEMRAQLLQNIECDRTIRFPLLLRYAAGNISFDSKNINELKPLTEDVQFEIEDKLQDLLTFFVIHLSGEYDHNLCHAVVEAVFMLERDVCQNNRIRRRILLPSLQTNIPDEAGI